MLSRFKNIIIPHAFIFVSLIVFLAAVLTYIIPSGIYERTTHVVDNIEQVVIVPGTYEQIPKNFSVKALLIGEQVEGKATPTSFLGLFTSIPKGMNQAGAIIFFVFIIGAVFNVIQHTGTINLVLFHLMNLFRNNHTLLYFIIFITFSTLSTFLGMGLEFIPLIPLFLFIAKQTGHDRIVGLSLYILPFYIGWAAGITNPFNVQIAQNVAELPLGSGFSLRFGFFVVSTLLGFFLLMRYANRISKNKQLSYLKNDPFVMPEMPSMEKQKLETKHILILLVALVLFATILFGIQTMGWGLMEMSGGFFLVGLCTILISGMSGEESMKAFVRGLEIMIVPALIVGFARAIQVVLSEAMVVDTILYETSHALMELPKPVAAMGMFLFQSLMNLFIPSASGQALVSMPLMVPLADLLGITRQTAVLAFVLGDGISNLIVPTNGILMASLGIAGISYEKWFKFVLPLILMLTAIAMVFMYIAVLIDYR